MLISVFTPCNYLYPILIFVVRTVDSANGMSYSRIMLLGSIPKIRIGRKIMEGTNTLAYSPYEESKKGFVRL